MPLFSVIIPTYNRRQMVVATIESVLAQTFEDYELIVVDDGSTDGTLESLAAYAGRLAVLSQKNQGPGEARNLGLRHATGQYIAFLDSDDIWFPWTLSTYAEVMATYHEPALVFGTRVSFSDPSELKGVVQEDLAVERYDDYLAAFNVEMFRSTAVLASRRQLLLDVGGFPREACEDLDLFLRLGTAPGVVVVRSPVQLGYRVHSGNSVHEIARTYIGTVFMIRQEKTGKYPGGDERRLQRLRLVDDHVRYFALKAISFGSPWPAMKLYLATIGWHIELRKFKFLAAVPVLALKAWLSRPFRRGAAGAK